MCRELYGHFSHLAVALWGRKYWLQAQVRKQVQGEWILLHNSVVSGGGILLWIQACLTWQSVVFVLPSHSSWWYCVKSAWGRGVHRLCGLEGVASWMGKEQEEETLPCGVILLYSGISLLVTMQLIEDKGPHSSSFFQFLISTRMTFFFVQKVLIKLPTLWGYSY